MENPADKLVDNCARFLSLAGALLVPAPVAPQVQRRSHRTVGNGRHRGGGARESTELVATGTPAVVVMVSLAPAKVFSSSFLQNRF